MSPPLLPYTRHEGKVMDHLRSVWGKELFSLLLDLITGLGSQSALAHC